MISALQALVRIAVAYSTSCGDPLLAAITSLLAALLKLEVSVL